MKTANFVPKTGLWSVGFHQKWQQCALLQFLFIIYSPLAKSINLMVLFCMITNYFTLPSHLKVLASPFWFEKSTLILKSPVLKTDTVYKNDYKMKEREPVGFCEGWAVGFFVGFLLGLAVGFTKIQSTRKYIYVFKETFPRRSWN